MKLSDSTAWECQYFNVLDGNDDPSLKDMGELEVLADYSDGPDYSGAVRVAFLDRNGRCCYLEYFWGSCDHCDAYMNQSDEETQQDILRQLVVLEAAEFIKFASNHQYLKRDINDLVSRLFN